MPSMFILQLLHLIQGTWLTAHSLARYKGRLFMEMVYFPTGSSPDSSQVSYQKVILIFHKLDNKNSRGQCLPVGFFLEWGWKTVAHEPNVTHCLFYMANELKPCTSLKKIFIDF